MYRSAMMLATFAAVSVERDECEAKFWLDPVRLARSQRVTAPVLRRIENVVIERESFLLEMA